MPGFGGLIGFKYGKSDCPVPQLSPGRLSTCIAESLKTKQKNGFCQSNVQPVLTSVQPKSVIMSYPIQCSLGKHMWNNCSNAKCSTGHILAMPVHGILQVLLSKAHIACSTCFAASQAAPTPSPMRVLRCGSRHQIVGTTNMTWVAIEFPASHVTQASQKSEQNALLLKEIMHLQVNGQTQIWLLTAGHRGVKTPPLSLNTALSGGRGWRATAQPGLQIHPSSM